MFLDGRRLDDGERLEADVCIIGAGAAAIPIALAFADTPTRVVVLESGGLVSDPGDRGIYRVVVGDEHGVRIDRRSWRFGGNTNHWFGNCRPLDEADFEPRGWVPRSGWPIRRDELIPFYEEAQRLCGLGSFATYDLAHQPEALRSGVLEPRIVQIASVLRFDDLHRERLESARNVRVYLHTRALQLQTNGDGGAVDAVRAVSADGRRCFVSAAVFILAAGGIENPRLLLCSDRPNPRGLGNDYDLVGRHFMEHPFIDIPLGGWRPPRDLCFYLYTEREVSRSSMWGQIVLSEELLRREELPGLSFWFQPASPLAQGLALGGRGRDILLGIERLQHPLAEIHNARIDVTEAIAETVRRVVNAPGCGLRVSFELLPEPQNRIRLVSERDRFGQPRVAIDFQLTDVERQVRSLKIAADELGLDARRVVERMLLRLRAGRVGFFWHHLGTTRMHRDPAQGVVDADCRVHGVRNLFVAGGSVFDTGGTAPPTLTIVALALRLAERVRRDQL